MAKRDYTEKELLDIIDNWHDEDDNKYGKPVWYYMGWTREQYAHWVETGNQPR